LSAFDFVHLVVAGETKIVSVSVEYLGVLVMILVEAGWVTTVTVLVPNLGATADNALVPSVEV
jgi:hypothetical protein